MKTALVAAAVIALVATGSYFLRNPAMDDPSKRPPRDIQIELGQTVRDFMHANDLPAENGRVDKKTLQDHYGIALDLIADTGPIIFGDHWLSPVVKVGQRDFRLPPGRTLFISQEAGKIKRFSFNPYARAQPLSETNRLVQSMLNLFLANGWAPQVPNSITFALSDSDADFKRVGYKIYGQLKDAEGDLLDITVTNLASAPRQPSYILTPSPQPAAAVPAVYVIRLDFVWAHDEDLSYGDLVYPRRIFVDGDKDHILPLRPWVEDPDWTPQAHGMIDLGGRGEDRRWARPAK